jgi:hypothetical protein
MTADAASPILEGKSRQAFMEKMFVREEEIDDDHVEFRPQEGKK